MQLDPDQFVGLSFSEPSKTPAGSVLEGIIAAVLGHLVMLSISVGAAVPVLAFVQWLYLLPLFLWFRHRGRFESAQGLFFGALVGCAVNLIWEVMFFSRPHY